MKQRFVVSAIVCLFVSAALAQPKPPAQCFGNVLQNGNFSAGLKLVGNGSMPGSSVTGWTAASRDPQLVAAGCGNPGFVAMWGNQVVGEAIQQKLSAPLTKGRPYRFSACVKFANASAAGPVRFKVRASSGPLASYTAAASVIGVTGFVNSTDWVTVSLPSWTPGAANLDTITINPENGSAVNSGTAVSWGHIDNVCLQPADLPVQEEIVTGGAGAAGGTNSYLPICKLKEGLTVPVLAEELSGFIAVCGDQRCRLNPFCESSYAHPTPIWIGNNDATFTAVQQNALLNAAKTIAHEHKEMCNGSVKEAARYEFRTQAYGNPKTSALYVTVHYALCGAPQMPN